MNRKPRVLFCGESSFLSTGYAVYTKNILQRLHATNKYEIAEFGIFGHNNDPHAQGIQWRFYGNLPDPGNEEQHKHYESDHLNKFGRWRFDQVCLDFQVDCVIDVRDVFMVPFEVDSPFKDFYHLSFMPAVDAFPQNDEWLAHYQQCDSILNYCQWGQDQLRNQCKNTINLQGIASPAADESAFFPIPDKKGLRDHYNLEEDIFIVGTVMRSQLRKRYSELFQAFAAFLKKAPPEIAKKTYLYCHTGYPDMGWHFPTLLKDFGLSSKVLFTYKCENPQCGHLQPSFFQEARAACPKCSQGSFKTPSSRNGLDPRELGQIYNLMDFYVQFASLEGFAMCCPEAAASGVPLAVVDYSAMEDFKNTLGAYPIKVNDWFREATTGRFFAVGDRSHLVEILLKYFTQPKILREKKRLETYQNYKKNYSWDKAASVWMSLIDNIPLKDPRQTWLSPPRIHVPPTEVPGNLPANELVNWAFANVMGRPDMAHSYLALRIIHDLNQGFTMVGDGNLQGFSVKDALDFIYKKRQMWNQAEEFRINFLRQKGLLK